eukprot:SAG31_NODE_33965_length_338_cov_0.853556_1_plen_95_part_01
MLYISKLSHCQAHGKDIQAKYDKEISSHRATTREKNLAEATIRQLREENAGYRKQLGMAEEALADSAGAKAAIEADLQMQLTEAETRVEELLHDL